MNALSVSEDLSMYIDNEEMSDVTLTVDDGSLKIHAHRFILGVRSPVFRAMLYGTTEESDSRIVNLKDMSRTVVLHLLEFMYTGKTNLDSDTVVDILLAANRFQLEVLQDTCVSFVENYVNDVNVCYLYETATSLRLGKLQNVCAKLLGCNWNNEKTQGKITSLSEETLHHFLSHRHQEIKEVDLFRIVLLWGKGRFSSDTKELSEGLQPFLSVIRFPTMTPEELVYVVEPSGVVPKDSLYESYRFIATRVFPEVSDNKEWYIRRFEDKLPSLEFNFPGSQSLCIGPSQAERRLEYHRQRGNRFWQEGDCIREVVELTSSCVVKESRWSVNIEDQLNVEGVVCRFSVVVDDVVIGTMQFESSGGSTAITHRLQEVFTHDPPLVLRSDHFVSVAITAMSTVPGGLGSWIWNSDGIVKFM